MRDEEEKREKGGGEEGERRTSMGLIFVGCQIDVGEKESRMMCWYEKERPWV
tara:strand:+ start:759 stop:914 length:156 start_codon:yes stop_codon:yes gene_type:complete